MPSGLGTALSQAQQGPKKAVDAAPIADVIQAPLVPVEDPEGQSRIDKLREIARAMRGAVQE